jgi:clorobiocin/coumermycin A biosynthesis protein CloN6/CouN6
MVPTQLPPLRADLLLLHAPASFDFRNRRDIYYPYLSTSGDVPITPLYEYFPVGFKTLQRYLSDRDYSVRILNLSSLLLSYPGLATEKIFAALDVGLVGIDLHWMVHVQGALEVARLLKQQRPDIAIIFGGISSNFYAAELIRYPFIDFVMRGYNTHVPMEELLRCHKLGGALASVPNLLWKQPDGTVVDNTSGGERMYLPPSYACGIDWSKQPVSPPSNTLPIREVLSTQNTGCAYNCGWCGGSREAYRRLYGPTVKLARKSQDDLADEFATMRMMPGRESYHFYSVGSYNEPRSRFEAFVDGVGELGLRSVSYEQYHLTPDDILIRMAKANPRTTITLSPESSTMRIAKLAGRGVYTMDEMEAWIERALGYGIAAIDVWFFIGMPEQGPSEVQAELAYCDRLLRRFSGKRVIPYLCPMIPFLDPASTFFCDPEAHGYRTFYRTVEEHRRGMLRASIIGRTNYETRWLPRRDLIHVGFAAVAELMQLRATARQLPPSVVDGIQARIRDALSFTDEVERCDSLPDPGDRAKALDSLGDEIERRNHEIFFSGVANQAYPIARQIGGRWFDELGWEPAVLASACG